MVNVCILTGYGINADEELAEAFRRTGAWVREIHLNDMNANPVQLGNYGILGIPGGFSFGDHLGSGKVFAFLIRRHLREHIRSFISGGGLVIGICNGFQVLVKSGILPDLSQDWTPSVSLVHNDGGTFVDKWVRIRVNPQNPSPWLRGLETLSVPIRHGEGRFVTANAGVSRALQQNNLVAFTYEDTNPNGSENAIAGITDRSGQILGLMPHPEAFLVQQNHPRWTRESVSNEAAMTLFRNGVEFVQHRVYQ
jgi:phosphoribosylformylglycinamidine synthase